MQGRLPGHDMDQGAFRHRFHLRQRRCEAIGALLAAGRSGLVGVAERLLVVEQGIDDPAVAGAIRLDRQGAVIADFRVERLQ